MSQNLPSAPRFCPGAIYYLSTRSLRRDPRIQDQGGTDDDKIRPFVCYDVDEDGRVYLAPLTTRPCSGRTRLLRRWFARAPKAASDKKGIYLMDPFHTYRGPAKAIACHLSRDLACDATRPALNDLGLANVRKRIDRRGGFLPPGGRAPKPAA